jgi:hypothetical protein
MVRKRVKGRVAMYWGGGFWFFVLRYLAWPPFAWTVARSLPSGLGHFIRWSRPLADYVSVAFVIILLWFSLRALLTTNWLLGIILLAPTATTFLVFAFRLQALYHLSHPGEHP